MRSPGGSKMYKWIAKIVLKEFAPAVVDSIIKILEMLAKNSDTTVDDAVVLQIMKYRDDIVNFLLLNVDSIIHEKTKI